jgi:chromosome segregation ATPase
VNDNHATTSQVEILVSTIAASIDAPQTLYLSSKVDSQHTNLKIAFLRASTANDKVKDTARPYHVIDLAHETPGGAHQHVEIEYDRSKVHTPESTSITNGEERSSSSSSRIQKSDAGQLTTISDVVIDQSFQQGHLDKAQHSPHTQLASDGIIASTTMPAPRSQKLRSKPLKKSRIPRLMPHLRQHNHDQLIHKPSQAAKLHLELHRVNNTTVLASEDVAIALKEDPASKEEQDQFVNLRDHLKKSRAEHQQAIKEVKQLAKQVREEQTELRNKLDSQDSTWEEVEAEMARLKASVKELQAEQGGLFVSLYLNQLLTNRLRAEEMEEDYTSSEDGSEVTYEL